MKSVYWIKKKTHLSIYFSINARKKWTSREQGGLQTPFLDVFGICECAKWLLLLFTCRFGSPLDADGVDRCCVCLLRCRGEFCIRDSRYRPSHSLTRRHARLMAGADMIYILSHLSEVGFARLPRNRSLVRSGILNVTIECLQKLHYY